MGHKAHSKHKLGEEVCRANLKLRQLSRLEVGNGLQRVRLVLRFHYHAAHPGFRQQGRCALPPNVKCLLRADNVLLGQ